MKATGPKITLEAVQNFCALTGCKFVREPRAAVQPGITATNEDLTVSLVAACNRIDELLARQGRLEEWLQKQGSALKRAEATIEVLSKWRNYVISKQSL